MGLTSYIQYIILFQVAVKALPYRDVFLSMLGLPGEQSDGADFIQCLMTDMDSYVTALDVVIRILDDFYRMHSIDTDDQI